MMGMRGGGFRVQRLISETAQTPDIVYLMVTDAAGNIVAHSDEEEIGKTHGTDLDLQRIFRSEKVQWRMIPGSEELPPSRFFAVFLRRESLFEVNMEDECRAHGQRRCGRRFLPLNSPRSFL
jgi:hypothetical protein